MLPFNFCCVYQPCTDRFWVITSIVFTDSNSFEFFIANVDRVKFIVNIAVRSLYSFLRGLLIYRIHVVAAYQDKPEHIGYIILKVNWKLMNRTWNPPEISLACFVLIFSTPMNWKIIFISIIICASVVNGVKKMKTKQVDQYLFTMG